MGLAKPGTLGNWGITSGSGGKGLGSSDALTVVVLCAVDLMVRLYQSSAKTRGVEIHYSGCNGQGGAILARAAGP